MNGLKVIQVKKEVVTKDGKKVKVNHYYLSNEVGIIKVQIEPKLFNNDGDKASWCKLRSLVTEIKEI